MRVWVTCYTDASYARTTGGAWAVWLRSAHGRIVRSGLSPKHVRDAGAAELSAIFAGVYLAIKHWGNAVRGIFVRSDSQDALRLADPASKLSRRQGTARIQLRLREQLTKHGVQLDCRWVKGHRPMKSGTSAWLNHHCDRLAKKARTKSTQHSHFISSLSSSR